MRGAWTCRARYSIRNYGGALYTALKIEKAQAEMRRYFTLPADCGIVTATLTLHLARVVHLTTPKTLRRIGVGRAGLGDAKNMVVFLDNQQPGWTGALRTVRAASIISR